MNSQNPARVEIAENKSSTSTRCNDRYLIQPHTFAVSTITVKKATITVKKAIVTVKMVTEMTKTLARQKSLFVMNTTIDATTLGMMKISRGLTVGRSVALVLKGNNDNYECIL